MGNQHREAWVLVRTWPRVGRVTTSSPQARAWILGVSHHPPMALDALGHKNTDTYTIMPQTGWTRSDILLGVWGCVYYQAPESQPWPSHDVAVPHIW